MVESIGKAVGPRGSRRRLWLILACVSLVAGMMTAYLPGALAVHETGAFELDGNAVDGAAAGDDWENVCFEVTVTNDPGGLIPDECLGAGNTSGATAISWTAEPILNSTIFTGGGSKDPIDIDSWAWKDGTGGLPDKSNLLHSFAARYSLPADPDTCPNGTNPFDPTVPCEVLFFGSDRFDNSGDAVQGFWFFQGEISLGDQKVGGGKSFNGVHQPGDLLVISEFSNGGGKSTIVIYEWDPTCAAANNPDPDCGDSNLRQLEFGAGALCGGALPDNDPFCGIVNPNNGETAPWSFTDKSGNNSYLNGEFYEAGVNLSTLGLADRCFASVSSETRTSTSTDAVLKDFILGTFGQCDTTLTTVPVDDAGDPLPEGGVPPNTMVRDAATLTVNGIGVWQGTLDFFLCAPNELDGDGLCSSGGTKIGSSINVDQTTAMPVLSGAANPTAEGTHCWRGVFTSGTEGVPNASDFSANECFEVIKLQPTMDTAQRFVPNDAATVTVASGFGDLAGTVVFKLYVNDSDCSEAPAYTSAAIDITSGSGSGVSRTVLSSNTTAYTTSSTFHWVVEYTSTNTSHKNVTSGCGNETSSITIDNGQTQPPAPSD